MTIYGWDASHYDAPQVSSAVADGIAFITHKAGGDRLDAELDEWWANARGLDPSRVLLGAYWVLYPGRPVERADAFLARLDAVCVGWRDRPFILQVDCEKWGGDPTTVPNLAEIRAFCDRLVQRTAGRYRPIVYAPKWVYGDSLRGLPYPLWASSYVSTIGPYRSLYPGDSSSRWGAYSGQTPAVLQYTSSATIGNQTTCDANAFRGTLAELTALVTGQPEEDEMPLTNDDADLVGDRLMARKAAPQMADSISMGGSIYEARLAAWAGVTEVRAARVDIAAVRAGQEAILGAVKGLDTKAVLARIDEVAQAEAARDVALAELVRAGQSGELDATEVLRRLGELLTAGTAPQS